VSTVTQWQSKPLKCSISYVEVCMGVERKQKEKVYKALVRLHLEYCCPLWTQTDRDTESPEEGNKMD